MQSLDSLALKYGTDKSSQYHNYCGIYSNYFEPIRNSNIYLFELGYGGYTYEDRGGESAKTWYDYFPNAKLVYLDLYDKKGAMNDRTDFFQGNQTDENLLKAIIERGEGYSKRIVIDDGSHINSLTIETFKIVFPLLKKGDLYFIEDVQTSYWSDYYEGNKEPGAEGTTMNYFTFLTHQLNDHVLEAEFKNDLSGKIEFIHFYKEMIVIKRL